MFKQWKCSDYVLKYRLVEQWIQYVSWKCHSVNTIHESDYTVGMDSRIVVDTDRLTISNLKKTDTRMLQCNASNVHGYLLANAYLNVQGNSDVCCVNRMNFNEFIGQPFLKRFVLCCQTVVLSVCLPVLYCPVLSCPVCDVGVLWPNGWMDQDEPWNAGRPRPWPHCVRWGPTSPPQKGAEPPNFRPMSIVAKWLDGSRWHLARRWASV